VIAIHAHPGHVLDAHALAELDARALEVWAELDNDAHALVAADLAGWGGRVGAPGAFHKSQVAVACVVLLGYFRRREDLLDMTGPGGLHVEENYLQTPECVRWMSTCP
jgi:hypothetical protein